MIDLTPEKFIAWVASFSLDGENWGDDDDDYENNDIYEMYHSIVLSAREYVDKLNEAYRKS